MRAERKHQFVFVLAFAIALMAQVLGGTLLDTVAKSPGLRQASLMVAELNGLAKCHVQQILWTYRDRASRALSSVA